MRWRSVLMALTTLQLRPQPKETERSNGWREIRPARRLVNFSPVPQTIACSFTLAHQIRFRNKIPPAHVQRLPVLTTTFGDGVNRGVWDEMDAEPANQADTDCVVSRRNLVNGIESSGEN